MTLACLCLMVVQVAAQETLRGLKTYATGKFRMHATVMESFNGTTHSEFFLVRVPKDSVAPGDLYTIQAAFNFRRYWHLGKRKIFAIYADLNIGAASI